MFSAPHCHQASNRHTHTHTHTHAHAHADTHTHTHTHTHTGTHSHTHTQACKNPKNLKLQCTVQETHALPLYSPCISRSALGIPILIVPSQQSDQHKLKKDDDNMIKQQSQTLLCCALGYSAHFFSCNSPKISKIICPR